VTLASTAGPDAEALIERSAFKAVAIGFPPVESSEAPAPAPLGPANYVVARPERFAAVRRAVLDALDPADDAAVTVATCPESRPAAEALLRAAAGEPGAAPGQRRLVLVVEACQLGWLRGVFAPLVPLRLPTAHDALEQRAAALRRRLAHTIEHENLDRELFLVGPLLERHDPAEIAAAALHLARPDAQPADAAPDAPRAASASGGGGGSGAESGGPAGWSRLWVGVGKKDHVRPGDLVGAIVGEARLAADRIGRIEVRDLFCLVEVPAEDAERVARALTGTTLRGRRVTARLDRGVAHPGATGGAGPRHGSPPPRTSGA